MSVCRMKRDGDVHCNLCEKSFTDFEFKNHFSLKHFPKKTFACYECDAVFQFSNDLLNHLSENHSSTNEKVDLKKCSPKNLFKDSKDVLRHTKESKNWIRFAFCYGFENPLKKKKLSSLVKDLYREEEDDKIKSKVCKFCDDINGKFYCYFCGKNFATSCSLKCHILNFHLLLPNTLKAATPFCDVCLKIFRSKALFEKHNNEKHKPETIKDKVFSFCQYCGKSLANKSNLKRHLLNQHSEQIGVTPVNNVFTCYYCKSLFSNKSSVKRHIENLHLKKKDTRKSISCFQCEQRFNSIKNLNAHLTTEHHVSIHEEKIRFSNLPEFWNWKQEEEVKTNSRFIQLRGLRRQRRKGEEVSTLKFVCNRSGIFHSKSNGKRAYRIKGSSKIGRYCSSYIEINFRENSFVDGTYCSTHSGHDNDLRYLALTMDDKREIYEKMKNGVTFSAILNEIRNSVGKEIKRKHLVTNKDLHNIMATFKKLSKANSESSDPSESSSNSANLFSRIDETANQQNPCFNNDLDICADLWVETCQRMISQSDQNQLKTCTMQEFCSKQDIGMGTHAMATKSDSEKEINSVIEHSHIKPDVPNFSHQYLHINDLSSSMSSLSTLVQPISSGTNNLWSRQPHNTSNAGQELGSQSNVSNVCSLYPDKLPPSVPKEVHSDLNNFCNLSTLGDVEMHKGLYPSCPSFTLNNCPTTVSTQDIRTSNICVSSYYTSDSVSTGIQCVQDVNSYDQSINSSVSSPVNVFDATYMMSEINDEKCGALLNSGKPRDSKANETTLRDIGVQNEKSKQYCSEVEDAKNEISDLRDRVNSVTALFNIVENELDERKKNIIRNYVDNMFRVLQYRYNKCKTKTKQSVKHKKCLSAIQKRLNYRRGNMFNQQKQKHKNLIYKKPRQTNTKKLISQAPFVPSSNFSAKNTEIYQGNFNNTILTDMRSDINLMRW